MSEILEQDPELRAMSEVFTALKALDGEAQLRVLEYVERRLGLKKHRPSAESHTEERLESNLRDSRNTTDTEIPDEDEREVSQEGESGALEGISPVAHKWMRRNDLSEAQVSALYSLGVDEIDLVAKKVPGTSAREKLRNVILLQGIASYLSTGAPRIDNEKLREATKHYDADVGGNFTSYVKTWASEVAGTRAEGNLTLTTRGLNSAKDLIKEITKSDKLE